MTPDQIELVETSFSNIGAVTSNLGRAFYERLFEVDGSTRSLFAEDIDSQGMRLMQVLAYAVSNLHAPDLLLSTVHDLGRRHAGYGVAARHFQPFERALIDTLSKALGARWNAETEQAWRAAFALIAAQMQRGGALV